MNNDIILNMNSFIPLMPGPLKEALLGVFFAGLQKTNQSQTDQEVLQTVDLLRDSADQFTIKEGSCLVGNLNWLTENSNQGRPLMQSLLHIAKNLQDRDELHRTSSTNEIPANDQFSTHFSRMFQGFTAILKAFVRQLENSYLGNSQNKSELAQFGKQVAGLDEDYLGHIGLIDLK